MANNVMAQVMGGEKKILENMDTVSDVKNALNCQTGYTALVNGDAAEDDDELNEGDFVTLSKSVKGGR